MDGSDSLDVLIDVERIVGSSHDDVLEVRGSIEDLL